MHMYANANVCLEIAGLPWHTKGLGSIIAFVFHCMFNQPLSTILTHYSQSKYFFVLNTEANILPICGLAGYDY